MLCPPRHVIGYPLHVGPTGHTRELRQVLDHRIALDLFVAMLIRETTDLLWRQRSNRTHRHASSLVISFVLTGHLRNQRRCFRGDAGGTHHAYGRGQFGVRMPQASGP